MRKRKTEKARKLEMHLKRGPQDNTRLRRMHLIRCARELKKYFACCVNQTRAAADRCTQRCLHRIRGWHLAGRTFFSELLQRICNRYRLHKKNLMVLRTTVSQAVQRRTAAYFNALQKITKKWCHAVKLRRRQLIEGLHGKKQALSARVRKWHHALLRTKDRILQAIQGKWHACIASLHRVARAAQRVQEQLKACVKKAHRILVIQKASCLACFKRLSQCMRLTLKHVGRRVIEQKEASIAQWKIFVSKVSCAFKSQVAACLAYFARIPLRFKQAKRTVSRKRQAYLFLYRKKQGQCKAHFTRLRARMQFGFKQAERAIFKKRQAYLSLYRKKQAQCKVLVKRMGRTIVLQKAACLACFKRMRLGLKHVGQSVVKKKEAYVARWKACATKVGCACDDQLAACLAYFARLRLRFKQAKRAVSRKRQAYLSLYCEKRTQLEGLVKRVSRTVNAQKAACRMRFRRLRARLRFGFRQAERAVLKKRQAYLSLYRKQRTQLKDLGKTASRAIQALSISKTRKQAQVFSSEVAGQFHSAKPHFFTRFRHAFKQSTVSTSRALHSCLAQCKKSIHEKRDAWVGLCNHLIKRANESCLHSVHAVRSLCCKQYEAIGKAFNNLKDPFLSYFQLFRQIPQKKGFVALCCLAAAIMPAFFIWKQEHQTSSFAKHSSAQFFSVDSSLRSDKLLCLNESPIKSGWDFGDELAADSLLFFQEVQLPDPPSSPVKAVHQETLSFSTPNNALIASATSESLLTSSATKSQPTTGGWQETSDPIPQHLSLSNTQATNDGFGDVQSYWSLNMMLAPTFKTNHYMPFIDLRWNTFNDCKESNKFAGNIGIGVRHIPKNCGPIWGGNIYYDYRHSSVGSGWNQVGLGVEIFGQVWEFRGNAYLPIGNKLHEHKCKFDDFNGDYTMVERKYEFMYTGFDTEVGCRAVATDDYTVYIGTGPYYINGKFGHQAWGIRVRFRPQYKDYLALDVMMTHDHVFQTIYQGELIVSLPFYALGSQKNKKPPCGITQRQIYQPVQRLDVIPVGRTCRFSQNF